MESSLKIKDEVHFKRLVPWIQVKWQTIKVYQQWAHNIEASINLQKNNVHIGTNVNLTEKYIYQIQAAYINEDNLQMINLYKVSPEQNEWIFNLKKFEGNQENPADKNFAEINISRVTDKQDGKSHPLKYSFTLQKEVNESVTMARTLEIGETASLKTRISVKLPDDRVKVNLLATIISPKLFSIPTGAKLGATFTVSL